MNRFVLHGSLIAGLLSAVSLNGAEPLNVPGTGQPAVKAHEPIASRLNNPVIVQRRELPPELRDTGFERYVEVQRIGEALRSLDAGLLSDLALQLAEGERILQRPHRAISSEQLLEIAGRIAAERRDRATLARLSAVWEKRGSKEHASAIAASLRQIAEVPAAEPALSVSVFETSPEAFAQYRALLDSIQLARAIGDATELEALEKDVADAREVPGKHRDYLKRLLAEGHAAVPKQASPATEALRSLAELGRRQNPAGLAAFRFERRPGEQFRAALPNGLEALAPADGEPTYAIAYRIGRDGRGTPVLVRSDRDGVRPAAWLILVIDPQNGVREGDGFIDVIHSLLRNTEGGPRSIGPIGERVRTN